MERSDLIGLPLLVICGLTACYFAIRDKPTLDRAQAAFELQEKRWNWQGWRDDGSLVCIDKGDEHRGCRVFIPVRNGVFGEPQLQLAVFSCSPRACDWILEPGSGER